MTGFHSYDHCSIPPGSQEESDQLKQAGLLNRFQNQFENGPFLPSQVDLEAELENRIELRQDGSSDQNIGSVILEKHGS